MLSIIKKYFFMTMFAILYVSFISQFIYVLAKVDQPNAKMAALGFLSLEWLILVSARYLSKRSSNSSLRQQENYRR